MNSAIICALHKSVANAVNIYNGNKLTEQKQWTFAETKYTRFSSQNMIIAITKTQIILDFHQC